eukprot:scaffold16661_cov44-Cyclotella_meneghiniana.AAC.2
MSELFSQKAGLMNPVCAPGMVPLHDKPHYVRHYPLILYIIPKASNCDSESNCYYCYLLSASLKCRDMAYGTSSKFGKLAYVHFAMQILLLSSSQLICLVSEMRRKNISRLVEASSLSTLHSRTS